MSREILGTAVVGAGPYGLSVAAHARARGVRTRVFGTPMRAWAEHMPAGTRLTSEPGATDLSDPSGRYTFGAFARDRGLALRAGVPVPAETFAAYGRWFREQTGPDLRDTYVTAVRREGPVFAVELADGGIVGARSVVLAAGFLPFPRVPAAVAELPPPQLLHSSELRDLSGFFGSAVAVIGAGQSALETAVLLAEQGADVTLIVRRPALRWRPRPAAPDRPLPARVRHPHTGLGPGWRNKLWADAPQLVRRLSETRRADLLADAIGPAGAWWLRQRFQQLFTGERVRLGTVVTAAKPDAGRVMLELETMAGIDSIHAGLTDRIEVDHVVAATGYEVDVRRLRVLDPQLRAEVQGLRGRSGPPVLGSAFQTSVPGLHVVGLAAAPVFGPALGLVLGCGFTARRLARALPRS